MAFRKRKRLSRKSSKRNYRKGNTHNIRAMFMVPTRGGRRG